MSYVPGSIAEANDYEAPDSRVNWPFSSGVTEASDVSELEDLSFEDSFAGESPFVAGEAFAAAGESGVRGDLHELLEELYDSEFDRNLLELSDAAAEAAAESPFVQGETGSPEAERFVREWLEPLHRDAHGMLEAIGETLADQDLGRLTEYEVDELLAPHEPLATGENPVFENFLGGLWRKAKGIVSGAVNLAKKGIAAVGRLIPIGPILDRLKTLVRPLLERVLQMALNRLPPEFRPAAEQLKRRLFGEVDSEEPASETGGPSSTTVDVGEVQREFDVNAASLLLAADETEQDGVVAEAYEATTQDEDPINELGVAREQLVAELEALPPGADPRPAVENFIPAVMAVLPFVRMGISLIGRDRIVRFIAQYVSGMIRPYVGDQAPALSQAIASTGLGMMSLEAPVEPRAVASTALAGAVEDTVRRVGEQASEALEHPDLLEATVASAFDEAAAHHFPPTLLKARLRRVHIGGAHPGAGPHPGSGMWVRLPRARWYRRYTKVLTARITPTVARQVRVFGGTTLEAFLRDHYGITGEVTAPVHLYEALPGATLGRIAAHETRVRGLGRARAYWKLQPLTPEIAGLLLGEPGLGRTVDPTYLARPTKLAAGQRFYYLELGRHRADAGRAAASIPGVGPIRAVEPARVPRSSHANVRVNIPKHRIQVALHLSEADAQAVAALLRGKEPAGAAKALRERIHDGLRIALSLHSGGHLHWIRAASEAGRLARPAGPPHLLADAAVARRLAAKMLTWAGGPMIDFVTRRPQEFISAVEAPADGVTLLVHLTGVPPLHLRAAHEPAEPSQTAPPGATVEIVPGFRGA
jgi:hypothetical protein